VKTCSDSASTTPVGNETFSVTLNTASPWAAGAPFSITVKAILGDGSTVDSAYSGNKTLVLTGPGTSPGGTSLTWPATVPFANGQATFSVSAFKAETVTLSVLDGTLVISGTSPSFTVQTGAAAKLAWTSASVSASSLSAGCYFSCTWNSAGNNKTFKASVSVTDAYGNIVSNIGAGHTVTFGKNAGSWSSSSLTLPSAGAATTAQNTYTTPNGSGWPAGNTASVTATSAPYLGATLTVNK
jgi:hypothetical protein